MHVLLASDHAGFALKATLIEYLKGEGYSVEDMGPHILVPDDDYPDYCIPLAERVAQNKGFFGIVIGLSGEGEAMAANRIKHARAAVYTGGPLEIVQLSREHNDANILSFGANFVSVGEAVVAAKLWLSTPFSGDERHLRRIEKLDQ